MHAFSSKSEALTSEQQESLMDSFIRYSTHSDSLNGLKYSTIHYCTYLERVNYDS